jgi:hypothetical protein
MVAFIILCMDCSINKDILVCPFNDPKNIRSPDLLAIIG